MPFSSPEERIGRVFGSSGDELPDVTKESLEVYYNYLKKHLIFPFDGAYEEDVGPLETTLFPIKVLGLMEFDKLDDPEFYGLICNAKRGRRTIRVPLAVVTAKDEKSPNYQLIDDYCTWFWNYR